MSYFKKPLNDQIVSVELGYNESHLAGAADLFESYFPAADGYDLQTILMQMHDQVHTRKLLIVGHSQGAIYANQVYNYLIAHGEPKESVAVYAVATPESYVAGGGHYRNFALDQVLVGLSTLSRFKVLPFNITAGDYINANGTEGDANHHSFANTYLALFPDMLVADMNTELWLLKSEPSPVIDGCFEAPTPSPLYSMQKGALTTADPIATGLTAGYQVASAAVGAAGNMATAAYGAIAGMFGHGADGNTKGETAATFTFLHALNLSSLSGKDAQELLGTDQGGAAILAVMHDEQTSATPGEVLGEATTTLPQDSAITESTTTPEQASVPELSVPIPTPNPAAGLVSHSDSQGGSSAPTPAETPAASPEVGGSSETATSTASTTSDITSSPPPPADTTGPSIVSVFPAWGSVGVDAATALRLVYDEALDPATVFAGSISLSHILTSGLRTWEPVPAAVSLESDHMTVDIVPLSSLTAGEYYSLGAGDTITDLAGNRSQALTSPVTNPGFRVATGTHGTI